MTHIQGKDVAAGFAARSDYPLLRVDFDDGFGIVALFAKDKFSDESVQHILKLGRIVRAVDDVTIVLEVELSLSSELASKILGAI